MERGTPYATFVTQIFLEKVVLKTHFEIAHKVLVKYRLKFSEKLYVKTHFEATSEVQMQHF